MERLLTVAFQARSHYLTAGFLRFMYSTPATCDGFVKCDGWL